MRRGCDVYVRPRSLDEALAAVAGGLAVPFCGGTDMFPAHVGRQMASAVVDVSAVQELRGISMRGNRCRIGGTTTWGQIAASELPPAFAGLQAAAREVGSVQIQRRGTIAGNLCNASPAADGIPPLLALDADVELQSIRGRRILPLREFVTGYRQTLLAPDEILTAVLVDLPTETCRSAFLKLGARRYLVISILMAAATVERDAGGRITRVAVAIGAASPVAIRLTALEDDAMGLKQGDAPSRIVAARHFASLSPIDDVRATAAYRLDAAIDVVGRVLDLAAGCDADG